MYHDWVDEKNYFLQKEKEKRIYNQKVEFFRENLGEVARFEELVSTHESLPLRETFDAYNSKIPVGSQTLYDIEDEIADEYLKKQTELYQQIYDEYTPKDLERHMGLNLTDFFLNGMAPGGAKPGDAQWGVWGMLGLEWVWQTFGPSGKINLLGIAGNKFAKGQPFQTGRLMEYRAALSKADELMQNGMSLAEAQDTQFIDISRSEVPGLGVDQGFFGEAKKELLIAQEAWLKSGETRLGALWNAVASNGVLSKEYDIFGMKIGKVDKPVNFDRNAIAMFRPVLAEDTAMYSDLIERQLSPEKAKEIVYNTIGKPLVAPDKDGELYYTSLNRPNSINFYAGRFTRNRLFVADSPGRHQAWEKDNTLLEYSPGKLYASEIYIPGSKEFAFASGAIDIVHQVPELFFGGVFKKGAKILGAWNDLNRASKLLDTGSLVKNGKRISLDKNKIIENTYDLLGKDLAEESTQNYNRLARIFNGNQILSESRAVRSAIKEAKTQRNRALIFGRSNKIFNPGMDEVLESPVWQNMYTLIASTPLEKISSISKMPLFRQFHPDILSDMLKMDDPMKVKALIKDYATNGRKVSDTKATLGGKNVIETNYIDRLENISDVGQSGIINAVRRYAADQADKLQSSKKLRDRIIAKPLDFIGDSDSAIRSLGSYVGQGVRGIGNTKNAVFGGLLGKKVKSVKAGTLDSIPVNTSDEVPLLKAKFRELFTDYGDYEIQKYLRFGGAYRSFDEPYFRNLLSIVPDAGLPLYNKAKAWRQLVSHLEINGGLRNELEQSTMLMNFLELDFSNKQSVRQFARQLADDDAKRVANIVGDEVASPLKKWVSEKFGALDRSVVYSQSRMGTTLPNPGNKFQVFKANLQGKFYNVPIANAFLYSQMVDNYAPLIPYQYINRTIGGIWKQMPSPTANPIIGQIGSDIKAFGQYLANWGDDAYKNPYFGKGIIPRKNLEQDVATRALDFYTRKVFKPLVLFRFAFLTRVFMEEQARMFMAGLKGNVYTHPFHYIQWLSSGKKMSNKKLLKKGYTQDEIDNIPMIQTLEMQEEMLEAQQKTFSLSGLRGERWNPANTEYSILPKNHPDLNTTKYTEHKLWDYLQVRTDPVGRKVAEFGYGSDDLNKWIKSEEGMFWRQAQADKSGDYRYIDDDDFVDQWLQSVEGFIREQTNDVMIEGVHYIKSVDGVTYRWVLDKHPYKGDSRLRDIMGKGKIPAVKNGEIVPNKFVNFLPDIDKPGGGLTRKWRVLNKKERGKAIDAGYKLFDEVEGLGLNGGWVRVPEEIDEAARTSVLDDGINMIFDLLMRRPIAYLNRSPVFKQYYWAWVIDNVNNMTRSLQKKYIRDAEVYKVPNSVVKQLKAKASLGFKEDGWKVFNEADAMPRAYALENLKDLLYDTSIQHKISDVTRNIFPFPEIWFEVFKTWGKLVTENPYPLRAGTLAVRGLRGTSDYTYNRQGYFAPDPFNPDKDTFVTPWGAWMGNLLVEDEQENMSVQYRTNLDSINLLAQSQVPGTNRLVSLAINRVLPSKGVTGEIKNFLSKFPMPEDVDDVATVSSSWRKFLAFAQGIDIDPQGLWRGDKDFINVFEFSENIDREPGEDLTEIETMRADATINFYRYGMVSGEYMKIHKKGKLDKYLKRNIVNWKKGTETRADIEDAFLDYSRDRAQVHFLLSFIGEFIGPGNYKPEYFIKDKNGVHYGIATLYELFQDELEKQNYDYTAASQEFFSKYGLDHTYLLSPTDLKVMGKAPKTKRTVFFWNENKDVKDRLPKSYAFMYPDNPNEERTWMEVVNGRYDLTPDEYRRYINGTVGFFKYNNFKEQLDTFNYLLTQEGTELSGSDVDLLNKLVRTALATDLEGYDRDEYGQITNPEAEDVWREISEKWEKEPLSKELEAGKFILEFLPVWRELEKQSGQYTTEAKGQYNTTWWRKSEDPYAIMMRASMDREAKELLSKYPDGFFVYYNIILRLLNADYAAFNQIKVNEDDIIDNIFNK